MFGYPFVWRYSEHIFEAQEAAKASSGTGVKFCKTDGVEHSAGLSALIQSCLWKFEK